MKPLSNTNYNTNNDVPAMVLTINIKTNRAKQSNLIYAQDIFFERGINP